LNFLFYGLTSEKYRTELIKVLCAREIDSRKKPFHQKTFSRTHSRNYSLVFGNHKNLNHHLEELHLLNSKCENYEKLLAQKDKELAELKNIFDHDFKSHNQIKDLVQIRK